MNLLLSKEKKPSQCQIQMDGIKMYETWEIGWMARQTGQRHLLSTCWTQANNTSEAIVLRTAVGKGCKRSTCTRMHTHTSTRSTSPSRVEREKVNASELAHRITLTHSSMLWGALFEPMNCEQRDRVNEKYDINVIKQKIYMWYRFKTVTMIHLALTTPNNRPIERHKKHT